MLTHALKAQLNTRYAFVLCRAVSQSGEKFCLYLQSKKNDVMRLMAAYEKGEEVDFAQYGEIVWRGEGENPPPGTREALLATDAD